MLMIVIGKDKRHYRDLFCSINKLASVEEIAPLLYIKLLDGWGSSPPPLSKSTQKIVPECLAIQIVICYTVFTCFCLTLFTGVTAVILAEGRNKMGTYRPTFIELIIFADTFFGR